MPIVSRKSTHYLLIQNEPEPKADMNEFHYPIPLNVQRCGQFSVSSEHDIRHLDIPDTGLKLKVSFSVFPPKD